VIDEGTDAADDDGDGYCEGYDLDGDGLAEECSDGSMPGDCSDGQADIHPGAFEIPGDGIDNDCDGIDGGEATDSDGDGWADSMDCEPLDDMVHPGATESADGLDNNCDGSTDEGTAAADDDGDGYCEGLDMDGDGVDDCSDGSAPGDCDDNDTSTNSQAVEMANGVDDDCDGAVDEDTIYSDDDGDGYSEFGGDCDDEDPSSYPGADDLPDDNIDQDCDGVDTTADVDEDADGWTVLGGDCNDGNAAVNPDAPELCDGVDNDCDDVIDPDELCDSTVIEVGGGCSADQADTQIPKGGAFLFLLMGIVIYGRRVA